MARRQVPGAVGVCEVCNMQFTSAADQYDQAEWDIGMQFSDHKCKREDVNQAIPSSTQKPTDGLGEGRG
jgi:hypothetical protein